MNKKEAVNIRNEIDERGEYIWFNPNGKLVSLDGDFSYQDLKAVMFKLKDSKLIELEDKSK